MDNTEPPPSRTVQLAKCVAVQMCRLWRGRPCSLVLRFQSALSTRTAPTETSWSGRCANGRESAGVEVAGNGRSQPVRASPALVLEIRSLEGWRRFKPGGGLPKKNSA